MSKLDVNYLDLVREHLYSEENTLPSKPAETSNMGRGKIEGWKPSKKTKRPRTANETNSQCNANKTPISEASTSGMKRPKTAKANKTEIVGSETRGVKKRKLSTPTSDKIPRKRRKTKKSKDEPPVNTETSSAGRKITKGKSSKVYNKPWLLQQPQIITTTGKFVVRKKNDNITPSLKCEENAAWNVEPQIKTNSIAPKQKKKKKKDATLIKDAPRTEKTDSHSALDDVSTTPALNGIKVPTKRQATKSDPIKKKSKTKTHLPSQTVTVNDIDDEKLSVKGLTFRQLCSQYTSKRNEQSQNPYTFCIPQKFYELDDESVGSQVENESEKNNTPINSDSETENAPVEEQDSAEVVSDTAQMIAVNKIDSDQLSDEEDYQEQVGNDRAEHMELFNSDSETENLNSPVEQQDSTDEDDNEEQVETKKEEYAENMVSTNSDSETENLNSAVEQDTAEEVSDVAQVTKVNNVESNQATDEDDNEEQNATKLPLVFDFKNHDKLIVLPHLDQQIYFHGLCQVEVLHGQLEIIGSRLTKKSGPINVYSPRGTALLYIKNDAKLIAYNTLKLADLLPKNFLNRTKIQLTFHQHAAIFVCKQLKEPHLDFVERYISQIIFPETVQSSEPRINFKLSGAWNRLQVSTDWEDILEGVTENSKVAICGGKGVGKSTFLRFAINVLLATFKKVRVVDLDPGQAEFVPPGCVYSITIDRPVFGPNFAHLRSPDNMLLSNIDIGHNMQHYLTTVEYLLNETEEADSVAPTLVNFPGYSQDIGLDIAANMLELLQPSLVIEMKSQNASRNYKMDLTSENIRDCLETGNLPGNKASERNLSYDYVKLDSVTRKSNDTWTLEGRQSREICLFAYFGQMMNENAKYFTSPDITMHSIQLSALTVADCDGKTISAMTINGNLVALCSPVRTATDIFRCHGYGFVRGLDLKTDVLVLITPEPTATLEKVTHLVLSSVSSPPSLIMTTQGVKGHIPFVNTGELIDFGQFTKRPYLPSKK